MFGNLIGIKFLDETSTDDREANVLSHALSYIDIYSNSWGPVDSGMFMEHLSMLVKMSLYKGVNQVNYIYTNNRYFVMYDFHETRFALDKIKMKNGRLC